MFVRFIVILWAIRINRSKARKAFREKKLWECAERRHSITAINIWKYHSLKHFQKYFVFIFIRIFCNFSKSAIVKKKLKFLNLFKKMLFTRSTLRRRPNKIDSLKKTLRWVGRWGICFRSTIKFWIAKTFGYMMSYIKGRMKTEGLNFHAFYYFS